MSDNKGEAPSGHWVAPKAVAVDMARQSAEVSLLRAAVAWRLSPSSRSSHDLSSAVDAYLRTVDECLRSPLGAEEA